MEDCGVTHNVHTLISIPKQLSPSSVSPCQGLLGMCGRIWEDDNSKDRCHIPEDPVLLRNQQTKITVASVDGKPINIEDFMIRGKVSARLLEMAAVPSGGKNAQRSIRRQAL